MMYEDDLDDFYEETEEYKEKFAKTDPYFLQAQKEIRKLYENNMESVYYIRQLQVKLENTYFHWITNNAIKELHRSGFLKDFRIQKERGTATRFFIHHSNRYAMRKIRKMEGIIEEYSQDFITRSCGHRAEDLFCKALAMRGFMPMAEKVREYQEKR